MSNNPQNPKSPFDVPTDLGMANLPFDEAFINQFGELLGAMTEPLRYDQTDMLADTPYLVGIMSGTSLDGMDAVLCQFHEIDADNDEPIELLATASLPFDDELRSALLALSTPNGVSEWLAQRMTTDKSQPDFASELDVFGWASVRYAELASELVGELLRHAHVLPEEIAAIGCHGQTVRHRPEWHFSLQLLDANLLAERTGIAVVSDFRRRDMAVGGQGAPLVPAFHQAMFGQFVQDAAPWVVLNLGGVANITVLAKPATDEPADTDAAVVGFDTGPANLLLDGWCQRHTGKAYDDNGAWAKSGTVIEPLLTALLQHEFFAKPAPKSTGREAFNLAWLDDVLAQVAAANSDLTLAPADVQATLTELTTITVAQAILAELGQTDDSAHGTLLVCGGGAYNGFLLKRLAVYLPNFSIKSTDRVGLASKWVEAAAFAWLARQTLTNQTGNLPSVTGASKAVVLGQVCF